MKNQPKSALFEPKSALFDLKPCLAEYNSALDYKFLSRHFNESVKLL